MTLNQRNSCQLKKETEEERMKEREVVIHNWPTEGAVDSGQCEANAAAQPLQFNERVPAHIEGICSI